MIPDFGVIAALALVIWAYLAVGRGGFWRSDQRLPDRTADLPVWPSVVAVIPARDEAPTIGRCVASLLAQDYAGKFAIVLVDDGSTDRTAAVARDAARQANADDRLEVVAGTPLPEGWTGKLWAMEQGVERAAHVHADARYILFTDADIAHAPDNVRRLVAKAETGNLALASLMVRLGTATFWEKLLIPAFVFFFQKLYPFAWVNDPKKRIAAAAGGCMLVNRDALTRAGSIASVRDALIDDCALARRIKRAGGEKGAAGIWLGLGSETRSLRPYPELGEIWNMVARSAYAQLRYSPLLLSGTIFGMIVVYLAPPAAAIGGMVTGQTNPMLLGLAGWAVMAGCYRPIVVLYGVNGAFAATLPVAGFLYMLMTISSAWRHYRGRGGAWKGRVYGKPPADSSGRAG